MVEKLIFARFAFRSKGSYFSFFFFSFALPFFFVFVLLKESLLRQIFCSVGHSETYTITDQNPAKFLREEVPRTVGDSEIF